MTQEQRLTIGDNTAPGRLTRAAVERLAAALEAETEARVVTLVGDAGVFCEGLDVGALAQPGAEDEGGLLERYGGLLDAIASTPRPVIALVDGSALGGGVGLAAAADLVIATPRATFGLPEALFGLIPAMVFPVLARRIGAPRARWLALGAASLSAADAWRIGLVDELTNDLDATLRHHLRRLSRMDARALAAVKSLAVQHDTTPATYRVHAAACFHRLRDSDDTRARLRRFLAGESPWPEADEP